MSPNPAGTSSFQMPRSRGDYSPSLQRADPHNMKMGYVGKFPQTTSPRSGIPHDGLERTAAIESKAKDISVDRLDGGWWIVERVGSVNFFALRVQHVRSNLESYSWLVFWQEGSEPTPCPWIKAYLPFDNVWSPGIQNHSLCAWRSTVRFPWRSFRDDWPQPSLPEDRPASMAPDGSFLLDFLRQALVIQGWLVWWSDRQGGALFTYCHTAQGAKHCGNANESPGVTGDSLDGRIDSDVFVLMRSVILLILERCIFEELGIRLALCSPHM